MKPYSFHINISQFRHKIPDENLLNYPCCFLYCNRFLLVQLAKTYFIYNFSTHMESQINVIPYLELV